MADYCTLAQVRARLPDVPVDAAFDALIGEIITDAAALIDRQTNRPDGFAPSGSTVKLFHGNGTTKLHNIGDVVSVSQLRVKMTTISAFTLIAATDYFLMPSRGPGEPARWIELTDYPTSASLGIFFPGFNNVELTGVWGWAAVPKMIEDANIELAVTMYRSRGSGIDPSGVGPLGEPAIPRAMPPRVYDLVRRYTRPVFA